MISTTTVCWTSYGDPESLVTVGLNSVALLCHNIVIFYNVKTRAVQFYKGDSPDSSSGISLLAGHPQYPLFAIAEEALRPSIYVMNYPEMEKLTHIPPTNDLCYLDIHLSEYLVAISGAPNYNLKSWNYRTGVLNAEKTQKPYGKHCMYPLGVVKTPLILYSTNDCDVVALETSSLNDVHVFHEIMAIKMGEDFEKSRKFNVAWLHEDPYVVNDYGVVSMISYGSFAFVPEWTAPQKLGEAEPRAYRIFNRSTVSLLVVNETTVYCIKKQPEWSIEWQIEKTSTPIIKMVTDFYGNVYATTSFGNVYYVDYADSVGSLRDLAARNCQVQSYCLLQGSIKEQCVLLLTAEGELRLIDIHNERTFSTIYIDDACCMETHYNSAFVAVGTLKGSVHFISYGNYCEPMKLGSCDIDDSPIVHLKLYDNIGFVVNEDNGIDILICDFKNSDFHIAMSLERERTVKFEILKTFLLDSRRAAIFISHERNKLSVSSEYMSLICWHSTDAIIKQYDFKLPHRYKDFTCILPASDENVQFMCPRVNSCIMDMLLLKDNREVVLQFSICNESYGCLNRICGNGNVITSATTGILFNFQGHNRSKIPYTVSKLILTSYVPYLRKIMDVCFKSRFLLVLYSVGHLMVFHLPNWNTSLGENEHLENVDQRVISAYREQQRNLRSQTIVLLPEITQADIEAQSNVIEELKSLRQSMRDLINDDTTESGQKHGVFRKFCVNKFWLSSLEANAKILCRTEAAQMQKAIEDQSRIRNWLLDDLIKSSKSFFSTKLHSFSSNIYLENYATSRSSVQKLIAQFDKFFMYDLVMHETEVGLTKNQKSLEGKDLNETEQSMVKQAKHFQFGKDQNVFEYIMSKAFDIQDINVVSNYQMYNEEAKLQIVLINALKEEFNSKFTDAKNMKNDIINYIAKTNVELEKIYSNMNCMLNLLNMNEYNPPALFLTEWKRDEFIDRILTVDDSEITAVNPRRRIAEDAPSKRGRMLLWPDAFFARAIMNMMDGVLEKLWEEEIKKSPNPPGFLQKKRPIELAGEEEKQYKAYEQTLVKLEQDRRKYLQILRETESKTLCRKNQKITKLNEIVADIAILKLKYDFAITRERLSLFNTKKMNFERIQYKQRINQQRDRLDKLNSYAAKYVKLLDFWARTIVDLKTKFDAQTQRDRQLERQFKVTYLNSIPAHLGHEMNKFYKRRPKLPAKALSSASVSNDVHERIMSKKHHKFPLPDELNEFLALLDSVDDMQNCPYQLEHKYWEQFVRLRRQRLESELRLKAIGYSILDAQLHSTFFTICLNMLKQSRSDLIDSMTESVGSYFDIAQNRHVVVMLSMGQLEANVLELDDRTVTVLHVEDIANVNEMIKEAGQKKIASMQRVAFFRRQVIYKEWEHQVMRANIQYLKYIFKLVQNCKMPSEILEVCRNWHKLEENKSSTSTVGAIEKELDKKKASSDERLKSIDQQVEKARADLRAMRASNNTLDKKIDGLKIDISGLHLKQDPLKQEKLEKDRKQRISKFLKYHKMVETVRRDYVQILELTTILELQRLRTYPTLGSAPQCALKDP